MKFFPEKSHIFQEKVNFFQKGQLRKFSEIGVNSEIGGKCIVDLGGMDDPESMDIYG